MAAAVLMWTFDEDAAILRAKALACPTPLADEACTPLLPDRPAAFCGRPADSPRLPAR